MIVSQTACTGEPDSVFGEPPVANQLFASIRLGAAPGKGNLALQCHTISASMHNRSITSPGELFLPAHVSELHGFMAEVRQTQSQNTGIVLPPPGPALNGTVVLPDAVPTNGTSTTQTLRIPERPLTTGAELGALVRESDQLFLRLHELRKTNEGSARLLEAGELVESTHSLRHTVVSAIRDGSHRSEDFLATVAAFQQAHRSLTRIFD